MSRTLAVSFVAPGEEFAGDALFEGRRGGDGPHSPNSHWLDCYAALRRRAEPHGIRMHTSDLLAPENADIVAFMVQPTPGRIAAFKAANPGVRTVLILLETALGGRFSFNPRNHAGFDAVLTYRPSLVDRRKYFPMSPHAYDRARIRTGLPFGERRVGCLVGVNRRLRFRSGLMAMRAGWRFSAPEWLDYAFCPGELITYRSEVGRLCARKAPAEFDIFGPGWDIHPETRALARPAPKVSTIEYTGRYRYYLALENHRAEESLISERIWDALWGDAVPVYCGNPNLRTHVPSDCFIDATAFARPSEMLDYLLRAPQEEWARRREAGRSFLQSGAVEPYLPEACADELLAPFLALSRAEAPPGGRPGDPRARPFGQASA
jgi:hypothetical protein